MDLIKNIIFVLKINIMNIETRKLNLIQEFLTIKDDEIVDCIEKLVLKYKVDLIENEFKPMSIKKFNEDIDASLDDAKNGKLVAASELKSKFQKWNPFQKL